MAYKREDNDRLIELEKQHQENSKAWHETDDPEQKAGLHRANEMLSKEIDAITGGKSSYDAKTGKWTTAYNDGNGNWKNSGVHSSAEFTYNQQKKIDDLTSDILASRFDYNPYTDPSYKAYEDMYRREGDRALKSTLAEVASAQGGMSSYAGTAAQQASNYYAQQLSDRIPYLEQLAYEKYGAELNNKYNMLSALQNDKANQYNMWYNALIRDDELTQRALENERYEQEYADDKEYMEFNKGVTLYQLAEQRAQQDISNEMNDYEMQADAWSAIDAYITAGKPIPQFYLDMAGTTREDVYADYYGYAPVQSEESKKKVEPTDEDGPEGDEVVLTEEEKRKIAERKKAVEDKINEIYEEYEQGYLTEEELDRRVKQIELYGVNVKE